MSADIIQPMRFVVDLESGLVLQPQRAMLRKGDKKANRVIARMTRDGEDVDLTGVSASGVFFRPPDGDELHLEGSVNGSEVSVLLVDNCYTQQGRYDFDLVLMIGDVRRTVLSISGQVHDEGSGAVIDLENVIPSIDDVIAQLDTMREATKSAQDAATAANAATKNAGEKATAANTAAEKADSAARKIDGMTVSAEKADEAQAVITEKNGVKHIDFKLPKGDKGDKGDTGPTGPKGDGLYAFHIDEEGHLIVDYDTDDPPPLSIDDKGHLIYTISEGKTIDLGKVVGEGALSIETDKTLSYVDGVLSVNTTDVVEQDNTLPITSAAVHTTVGNIEVLLQTI